MGSSSHRRIGGLGSLDVAVMLPIVTVATLWIMVPIKRLGHLQEAGDDGGAGEVKTPRDRK